jgi:hypothetical protein
MSSLLYHHIMIVQKSKREFEIATHSDVKVFLYIRSPVLFNHEIFDVRPPGGEQIPHLILQGFADKIKRRISASLDGLRRKF